MADNRETYSIDLAGLRRELTLFEVNTGVRIAVLNILGDTELVQACARALAEKLASVEYDVLITAEAKSIPLIHSLAVETGQPYIVLRKTYKPYMGVALSAETLSITTGNPQMLYLDAKDRNLIEGKRVMLVDDVISTGSTLQGMQLVVEKGGGTVAGYVAICTEGERAKWADVIALEHLPIFTD